MTLHPGWQTITIHKLSNMSQRQPDNEIWSGNKI